MVFRLGLAFLRAGFHSEVETVSVQHRMVGVHIPPWGLYSEYCPDELRAAIEVFRSIGDSESPVVRGNHHANFDDRYSLCSFLFSGLS